MFRLSHFRAAAGFAAAILFPLGAEASTDGKEHRLVTYLAWYGLGVVMVAAAIVLTVVIERRKADSGTVAEVAPATGDSHGEWWRKLRKWNAEYHDCLIEAGYTHPDVGRPDPRNLRRKLSAARQCWYINSRGAELYELLHEGRHQGWFDRPFESVLRSRDNYDELWAIAHLVDDVWRAAEQAEKGQT